jgi:hypothetical protein
MAEITLEDIQGVDLTGVSLDSILEMPMGYQRHRMESAFMLQDQLEEERARVLIKTNSGRAMDVLLGRSKDGETPPIFKIGPRGRRVSRRVARQLLMKYGKNGLHRGRDQATGLRAVDMMRWTDEQRERWDAGHPDHAQERIKPTRDYLIHVPDKHEIGYDTEVEPFNDDEISELLAADENEE